MCRNLFLVGLFFVFTLKNSIASTDFNFNIPNLFTKETKNSNSYSKTTVKTSNKAPSGLINTTPTSLLRFITATKPTTTTTTVKKPSTTVPLRTTTTTKATATTLKPSTTVPLTTTTTTKATTTTLKPSTTVPLTTLQPQL